MKLHKAADTMVLVDIATSFLFGLLTPLTAVCVLPLYPGFLAYLSNKLSETTGRRTYILFGILTGLGVLSFMLLVGILFTTVLQVSLTRVVSILSPIAFFLLALISILLLLDVNFGRFVPHIRRPVTQSPLLNAFLFGFFFGAIVLPCNPGFIAAFFTRALLFESTFENLIGFSAFGFGMAFPLVAFSVFSARWSQNVMQFLIRHKTPINRIAGGIMLLISLYYLLLVFDVIGIAQPVKNLFALF